MRMLISLQRFWISTLEFRRELGHRDSSQSAIYSSDVNENFTIL